MKMVREKNGKNTPINPIPVGIRGLHRKTEGHKDETGVVTKAIRRGHITTKQPRSMSTLYLNCIGSTGSCLVYPNNPKQMSELENCFPKNRDFSAKISFSVPLRKSCS